ncbi:portal protein [Sinorhizobium fredii]|uniref:portal protein n=1 Tax=Rhizobium fredii TaxID=380 RepID=UPI0035145F04
MTDAATNSPFVGESDSGRPSLTLDDAANLTFNEPEEANEENEEEQQSTSETGEASEDGQETDDSAAEGDETAESEEEEASNEAQDTVITLKGGEQVPLEELKLGYLRERDYRHKTQELGNKGRNLEAMTTRVASTANAIADFLIQQMPQEPPRALADYYELYVKIDVDDDGIAELRRMCFAGGLAEVNLLEDEEWDEVPFADLIVERRPHQREGNSVTDDMAEIQRVKTVLMRQTLDNLYWQNNQQPIVQEGTIMNPESVLNPKFGQPIRVGQGTDVRAAIGYNIVPMVADKSFAMLSYLDQEATDRTGISDASSGMAPDALQNMTAKASAMIEQAGIGQTELMVRTFAQGLRRVFKGLLKLVIKHQDKPRSVRLRGQWVTFDPRHWNAEMDATVNTGLGAGTRERDMMMMQVVGAQQEKLLAAYGPTDNPFVSIDNIWNSVSRGVEAAGLRTPNLYFTKPTPEQIQKMQQAAANQPNPELEKVKMQSQADMEKAKLDAQLEQQKLATEAQIEMKRLEQEMALKKYQIDQEIMLKRQQNAAQMLTREPITDARIGGMPG